MLGTTGKSAPDKVLHVERWARPNRNTSILNDVLPGAPSQDTLGYLIASAVVAGAALNNSEEPRQHQAGKKL